MIELRRYLSMLFLDWAYNLLPTFSEKTELARALMSYFEAKEENHCETHPRIEEPKS